MIFSIWVSQCTKQESRKIHYIGAKADSAAREKQKQQLENISNAVF